METSRVVVPELEEILEKPFKVLDDGFIRVVDYMGGDESIVQAARTSYGKGTKKVSEDRGLIRYLMRHMHTTPFEMCEIKFHVRVPMDCWRQWIRHRMANVNEYSTRYSEAIDSCQKTPEGEWREQAPDNKQGSAGFVSQWPAEGDLSEDEKMFYGEMKKDETAGKYLTRREKEAQQFLRDVYQERLKFNVAREQARKDLPLSTYTEAYWKCDLHNLMHFLALRMDGHAQKEIRDFANVVGNEIVAKWCPLAWTAFKDYRMNSVKFSSLEFEILSCITSGNEFAGTHFAREYGWLDRNDKGKLKRNRERTEFEAKLKKMAIRIPWEHNE